MGGDSNSNIDGQCGVACYPVLVSTSTVYAQAEALEKEAAQLKMQAQQLKLNDLATSAVQDIPTAPIKGMLNLDILNIDEFNVDTPWQSPGTTPRQYPSQFVDAIVLEDSAFKTELHGKSWADLSEDEFNLERTAVQAYDTTPSPYKEVQTTSAPTACVPMGVLPPGNLVPCNAVFYGAVIAMQVPDVAPVQSSGLRTTLMLRNLPNDYTREMTLELLDERGLRGQYDFFYLPVDFQTNSGLGYAFLNFITPADAERAYGVLQGFSGWKVSSAKVLEVVWSELSQGLQANIERYRNSSVLHPSVPAEFQPVLFQHGQRVAFPAPTQPIQQPRLRLGASRIGTDNDACASSLDMAIPMTPWDRIKKTISVLNSGDLAAIVLHAKETLSSRLSFLVPDVVDSINTVGQVCSFHKRLHDAIPDLTLSLDHIGEDDNVEGAIRWRVTCTGTQVKKFIPHLPIDARARFALEVSVKANGGKPTWVCWNFGVSEAVSNPSRIICIEDADDADLTEKELKHRSGDCQPCAYFAFRADGCRAGDDCEFCHLCTKAQAKSKKKAKAARLKAGLEADNRTFAQNDDAK